MTPLPTIANVFRVSIVGESLDGVRPVNVVHMACASGDVTDLAGAINDALPLDLWYPVPGDMQPVGMDILPLDGVSASAHFSLDGWNAQGGSEFIPEACAVVSLRSTQRGPRGRGRVFVGPVGEANTSNGTIGSTTTAALTEAWDGLQSALSANDPVCSIGIASYVHADYHVATSIHTDSQEGTQRRRLLQQR